MHAQLRRNGVRVSEKVVRRLMRELGLAHQEEAPPNLPLRPDGSRDFSAARPNELWVTDITEFRIPSGGKCYLSPVIDCFNGRSVAWAVGTRSNGALADQSLETACETLVPGEEPSVYSDRASTTARAAGSASARRAGSRTVCRARA